MAKEVKENLTESVDAKCQCGSAEPKEESVLWGKVAKLTVLDKIIRGMVLILSIV